MCVEICEETTNKLQLISLQGESFPLVNKNNSKISCKYLCKDKKNCGHFRAKNDEADCGDK